MKFLLDSNILRHYSSGHLALLNNLAKVPASQVSLPFIVVAEQMRGRYDAILKAEPENLLKEQERLLASQALVSEFEILYLDEQSVSELLRLQKTVRTKKRYADVIIAALASAGGHLVITRNVEDFKDLLPAARIQNWIDQVY